MRTTWTIGRPAARNACARPVIVGSAADEPGISSGWPAGVSRCTPLVLAAEARDLDALSGGRLILGLGTGTQRMQRDWHGLDGEHPAPRMEELVPLIRALVSLDRGAIEHDGRFYRSVVHPTAPVPPPLRRDLPIFMAGVNARMIEAAGAVADGLVGHPLFTPEYTREVVRPALARGAERTGRQAPPIA